MVWTCQAKACTGIATDRLGWWDDDTEALWYSFLCPDHAQTETPDT
jgi:hypothetical protein